MQVLIHELAHSKCRACPHLNIDVSCPHATFSKHTGHTDSFTDTISSQWSPFLKAVVDSQASTSTPTIILSSMGLKNISTPSRDCDNTTLCSSEFAIAPVPCHVSSKSCSGALSPSSAHLKTFTFFPVARLPKCVLNRDLFRRIRARKRNIKKNHLCPCLGAAKNNTEDDFYINA